MSNAFTKFDCKDIGNRKSEFVKKNQILSRIIACNLVNALSLQTKMYTRWTEPVGSVKQTQDQAGYCKSLNAPWELSQLALRQDYAKKIWQAAQTGQGLFEFKFTTAKMYKLSYKNKAVFCPLLLFNLSKQQTLCIFLYQ